MTDAIKSMLSLCTWVKFIDPYFSACKQGHKKSLKAFLTILKAERPVGPPRSIEIHTRGDAATTEFITDSYKPIIPTGLKVIIFQWQERPGGQKLHNRYILTDLGGISFQHGLDTGAVGETDDIARLYHDQYTLRCMQYDINTPEFDEAAQPLVIEK